MKKHSADFYFDLYVHSCQLSNQVSEHIRHRDDINLSLVLTELTLPFRRGVVEGGVRGCGFLKDRRHNASTLFADTTLKEESQKISTYPNQGGSHRVQVCGKLCAHKRLYCTTPPPPPPPPPPTSYNDTRLEWWNLHY